eukprot:995371-Prymnesium_polylepis.1
MRLRPRPRVTIEQQPLETTRGKTICLLSRHVRKIGSEDPHDCVICQKRLSIHVDGSSPDWAQCPVCKDVVHKWVDQYPGEGFTCP